MTPCSTYLSCVFIRIRQAINFYDSRVAAQHRSDRGSVTIEDLETLRTQDIIAAVTDACAEKHVPLQL
ncbi:MAG: hypothetical protein QOE12_1027 [Mycobacterium sp.]|nr:hypothetical protein [Mycobacterium sp.]